MDVNDIRLAIEPYYRKMADCQTADEIRDLILDSEIEGIDRFGGTKLCGIARYITQLSGMQVAVGAWGDIFLKLYTDSPLVDLKLPGTAAMGAFVRKFDIGGYPELAAKNCGAA